MEDMVVNNMDERMSIDLSSHTTLVNPLTVTVDSTVDNSFCSTKNPATKGDKILIVTNVDPSVFTDQYFKSKFEHLFRSYDQNVDFKYLKSFKRVRLDFSSERNAETARLNLNNYRLGNSTFRCYRAQMITLPTNNRNMESDDIMNDGDGLDHSQSTAYLNIPKPTKQFLISPPASPPVGWEPVTENSPCIDVQLISAIANLVPGQVHEIHPGSESQPGIYVEVCEEPQFERPQKVRTIPKTPNPCIQLHN